MSNVQERKVAFMVHNHGTGLSEEESDEYSGILMKFRQWVDEKKLTIEELIHMLEEDLYGEENR
jgi:hypothetical protein